MITKMKLARQAVGINQELMAKKVGTNRVYYNQLENGKYNVALIPDDIRGKVKEVFGESIEQMLQPVKIDGIPALNHLLVEAD